MKILITAGGTVEKIDEVRCITNHSTGAMGRAVAEAFLRLEQTEEVIYVCGESAVMPQDARKVRILRVAGMSDLKETLKCLLSAEKVDGIAHCMAVSDYTVDTVTSAGVLKSGLSDELSRVGGDRDEIAARFPELLDRCLHAKNEIASSGKISSEMDNLILVLKRTPKIIGMFKELQPQAVLVGFKLLNRVPAETLIEAGLNLLKSNGCDFVFANDKADVIPESHGGYLIRPDGSFDRVEGRAQIAEKIASGVAGQIIRKGV